MVKDKNLHVGEKFYNRYGTEYEVMEYIGNGGKVRIRFNDDYKYETILEYKAIKNGKASNPYDKSCCGVGAIGNTYTKIFGKVKESYKAWKRMLERCYNKNQQDKYRTYNNCKVCKEWLLYENFEKWFDKNYYTIENQIMEVDKDILIKGNKIYSPETSIIVPHEINYLFIKKQNYRGNCPIGVCYHKRDNKYTASCSVCIDLHKVYRKHLGYFDSELEAFNAYKIFKENYIKSVAQKFRAYIPLKLYNALFNYKVEITD